jgi:purine-nucleoside phosphorylase
MPPTQDDNSVDDINSAIFTAASKYLQSRLPEELLHPKVAIICGSGLGGLVDTIDETNCKRVEFKYDDIPGFVSSTG